MITIASGMKIIMGRRSEFEFDISKIVDAISKVNIRAEENEIERLLQKRRKNCKVYVCGSFCTGKSTIINSILGNDTSSFDVMLKRSISAVELFAGIGGMKPILPEIESNTFKMSKITDRMNALLADCGSNTVVFSLIHELEHIAIYDEYYDRQRNTAIDTLYQTAVFEIERLEKRRQELRTLRKIKTERVSNMIRTAWLNRNLAVGRSSTSSVTDTMLLSIPTPPTFKAANRSLMVGGAVIAF